MSRRTERVANLIRNTIGRLLPTKLSDPRIDPARTTITHVEITEDLLTAKVFVSVIGTAAEQRRTLQGLSHAAGRVQDLLGRQVRLRHTPVLEFVLDEKFKKTLRTLDLIRQAMEEIRQKEQAEQSSARAASDADDDSAGQ